MMQSDRFIEDRTKTTEKNIQKYSLVDMYIDINKITFMHKIHIERCTNAYATDDS